MRTQRSIDLVHDIQRRGLVVVQSEDERQAGERLLAAAQVCDVLPALLGRSHAEHDPLRHQQGTVGLGGARTTFNRTKSAGSVFYP